MNYHGKKRDIVLAYLYQNINMPTILIVKKALNDYRIGISKRQIQRIRKQYKKELAQDRQNELNITRIRMRRDAEVMGKQISDHNIMLINMANEGNWTIQEIATELKMETEDVRNVLREFHWMLLSDIMDDDAENVYFNPEETPIETTEEDTFDTETTEEDTFDTETTEEDNNLIEVDTNEMIEAGVSTGTGGDGDFWEIKIETVTACSKCSKTVNVFVSSKARNTALMYMKWAGAREWLAYLIGEFKNGAYHVHDLYLPDQRTSAHLVDKVVADKYNEMTVIGVIHSHHEMGAGDENNPSFSGHDADFINGNHNLSLLAGRDRTSNGFKIVGIARIKTDCGALMKVKAKIKSMIDMSTDEKKKMKKEFLDKTQTQEPQGFVNNTTASNVTHHPNGRKTYHFNGSNGYPANQVNTNQRYPWHKHKA